MKRKYAQVLDPEDIESIKQNIAKWRKKKGLSQIELAKIMGVTQRVISYYENEAKNISLDAVSSIAKAIGVPRKKLLDSLHEIEEAPPLPKALQKRFEMVRNLSAKSQRLLQEYIDMLAKAETVGKNAA